MRLIDYHDRIVRNALAEEGGRDVEHTGDGIMSSFTFVSRAVGCATKIQREFVRGQDAPTGHPTVRIGISAGDPVDQSDDLFGASVNLASRICGHARGGQILVSQAVKELSIGKSIEFVDCGSMALKGFDEAVRLFEVEYD